MNHEQWQRQTKREPLFKDMLWSRPENKAFAGKLLIIGGNVQSFAAVAEAYATADAAGAGQIRVLLPDALQKSVSALFPAADYAPSTPSGSFARLAVGELLPMAARADGVLLAGDLGRNSETAIMLETFMAKHDGPITLTKDAIEYAVTQPALVADRPDTLLVLSFSQLQKLAAALRFTTALTSTMDLIRTVEALHQLTTERPFAIMTKHLDQLFVAEGGHISTTPCPADDQIWRLKTAASASVWWAQNPNQLFTAATSSVIAD